MSDDREALPKAGITVQPASEPREPAAVEPSSDAAAAEMGGPEGPEPTRFGDWEKKGRCIDF